jgi:uncharacterized repeat protein (TIGR03806 family)
VTLGLRRTFLTVAACLAVATACSDSDKAASATASDGSTAHGGRSGTGVDARAGRGANDASKGGASGRQRDASLDGAPAPPFGFDERPVNTTCVAPPRSNTAVAVGLARAFPSLPAAWRPIGFFQAPGDSSRWFVVGQGGTVQTFPNDATASALTSFLDIHDRVNASFQESGLLGMAFDPHFASNGIVYLSYTGHGGAADLTSHVSRFVSRDGGKTLDPASEEILLSLEQPYTNHNGGNVLFGPDGFLYVGFGDGGSAGDPANYGQNRNVLFGKMLRIDVSSAGAYTIPKSNPFASGGGKPEIFAFGFRNPWRWSFDRDTGDLWVGDVGQGTREEVDRVKRGGNYGWKLHEGTLCTVQPCPIGGYINPIIDYPHTDGVAVIGGYVYRGTAVPALVGTYLYGDYVNGKIWGLSRDPKTGAPVHTLLANAANYISSFGQGVDGEVYVVEYITGFVMKVVPRAVADAGTEGGAPLPAKLSATGCVEPSDPTKFAKGVVPYGVNVPYWSDGVELSHAFAIPDGTKIKLLAGGRFELPNGSVLVQTASKNGKKLDTRFLVRHDDGDWSGYAYAWNAEQTDATLLTGALVVRDGSFASYVTHPGECLSCHSATAGRVLGFESRQLNRDFSYPNGAKLNQFTQLTHIGLFDGELDASTTAAAYPSLDGTDPIEVRARAYLDVNCAMCHRQGGVGGGVPDLRFDTLISAAGLCNVAPKYGALGVTNPVIVSPGAASRSILSLRMHADDWSRMPPLESLVPDADGADLVDRWIASGATCPPARTDGGG